MASDQSESWSSEDNLSRERLMRKPLKGLNLSNDWPGVRSKLHGEETSGKACRPLHDIRAASLWMNPFVKTSSAKPQNDTNNYVCFKVKSEANISVQEKLRKFMFSISRKRTLSKLLVECQVSKWNKRLMVS